MPERILVAMSGGVDSSVAAARLVQDGYEVVGVTLHLWDYPDDGSVQGRCCAPEDVHDARRVADALGVSSATAYHWVRQFGGQMLPIAALFGVVRSSGVVGVDEKWVQVPTNAGSAARIIPTIPR